MPLPTIKSRPPAAGQIRARWEELKAVTEGFVAYCEKGNFGALERVAKKS
jgi:hypothetical protein